jgi:outer membrane protein assembly factor BamD
MKFRALPLLIFIAVGLLFSERGTAAVVFKPGEKAKYVPPGEEELNGNASELFQIGQKAESRGNKKRAIRAYRTLVRRHPKDALAPSAAFLTAKLLEQVRDYPEAASSYRYVVEKYPSSPHFDEAIEGQFRIGEMYLAGRKLRLLGVPVATSMDRAVEIFAAVIRTAPYGKYTARAQFDIGLAREKQGLNDAALQAYQAVVDKFPSDPIAAEAQYQIGYIWLSAARTGTKDIAAAVNASTAFQDFLARYPNSEKAAQARSNLQSLGRKTTVSSFDVAKFYDKQRSYRAAVIYYNEVIRQQPGSPESEKAKRRIDQLRAKLGDKVVEAALEANEKTKKTDANQANPKGESQSSPSGDTGALPPPETDTALPPPASLVPDTTNSALPTPTPEATPNAESSPAPETTATPEEVPSTTSEPSASPSESLAPSEPAASPSP